MSGQPFLIDHATLHQAAQDVRSTRAEVDGDLKRLSAVVDDLAGGWQGVAATSFQQLMVRWRGDTDKLLTALAAIADLLDRSGTQHQRNEEEQDAMLNKFTSVLNP